MSEPTERDRRVAVELLGWDADDALPFSEDPEAAAEILVERLERLGVRVEVSPASSSVVLYRGLRRLAGASGATTEEALVKACLRWVEAHPRTTPD